MKLDKFLSEGGHLTLSDIREKFGIPTKVAKDLIAGLYPNLNPLKLGGHTDQYPRLRYDGVHLSTREELANKADVCFLAITQIEFDTVVGVLEYKEELSSSGEDLRWFAVGYRGNTISLVGQSMAKRAIRAYGAATALFPLAESCRFFFKVGGAAGRYERGTIAILCRGSDGVVVHAKTVGALIII
ncbi:uncharacterized protein LOC131878259 [Tigriopus californicus]|uniref:uncharacterized protein LOC131878259 n=1 Tax=Tigriopus californicus TaxID=6832 RepID=UPI0027DA61E6|nr:uncharacterized protein LOC131878259 [Tigriopus californicus]